ncbi:MAG: hypothetical protein LBL59_02405 [Xanthomonadaceae bacterium]|jgi:outer membrane murein-binding lipoprotein Lpp|nr:hypothetical protein [Xanthomonadaceae bacterium]
MSSKTNTRRLLPAVMLSVGMAAPGMAMAQSDREQALEARMAQMEEHIQQLVSQQRELRSELEQARSDAAQAQQQQAAAPAVAAAPAGKPAIQNVSIVPAAGPGTTFKFGGYIKADFIATRAADGQFADSASGRYLYMPGQTPVGGRSSSTDFDAHAKFSRFNLGVDSVTENGDKLGGFFEMDFFGSSASNYQTATNSYGLRLRHAYMYWNNWLAGQTWSNFVDTSVLPESADFIGVTDGVLMVRQAQIRYTNGPFSVALENPETTYLAHDTATRVNSDRGWMPDLTARYSWKGSWGQFSTSALVRQLRVDNGVTKDNDWGGGLAVTGKWNLGENDDLRYQLSAGRGIARYIGLGIQSDAMMDANGELDAIDSLAGYVGWQHRFNSKLRTNLIYARSDYDIDDVRLNPFRSDITRNVQSVRANLMYSPMPRINLGAELMYGRREVEDGQKGDITRLQFSTKYVF